MGTETTLHMLLGAVVGWAILSPLAKHMKWAPGEVDDWENGSKGWIVWVSLAIMLADAVISLGYVGLQPLIGAQVTRAWGAIIHSPLLARFFAQRDGYSALSQDPDFTRNSHESIETSPNTVGNEDEADAPPDQRITPQLVMVGLAASVALCVVTTHIVFGYLVPLYATITAVLMALVLSIMGVRALGETDLNPVSGISKLAQLFFGLIIPQSNKSSVLINLVAGAVVSIYSSNNDNS